MSSHTRKTSLVSDPNSQMRPREIRMPIMGTIGTRGVRKGRLRSGSLLRIAQTLAQTMANAVRVPMLVSSAKMLTWKMEATNATAMPTNRVETYGVLNLGWTLLAHLNSRPSLDMV